MLPPPPRSTLFPYTTLFRSLKRPWPDFMTFYAGATGAGWIVPKKNVEKVGDEGFKKRSEEHTSELQSHHDLVCRLLLEKKKKKKKTNNTGQKKPHKW